MGMDPCSAKSASSLMMRLEEAEDATSLGTNSASNGALETAGETANEAADDAGAEEEQELESTDERRKDRADDGKAGNHPVEDTKDGVKQVFREGGKLADKSGVERLARKEALDEVEDRVEPIVAEAGALESGANLREDGVDVDAGEAECAPTEETAEAA